MIHLTRRMAKLLLAAALLLAADNMPVLPALAAASAPAAEAFARLLGETGVKLRVPPDLVPARVPMTDELPWQFDRAWRSADGRLELRLMARPIARMRIDYDDPHSAAPNPDHVYPLVFQSLIGQLAAAGSTTPTRFFPAARARGMFNADWAAMAAFTPDPALKTDFREAMLLALHKKQQGDVYLLFLMNDPAAQKARIRKLMKMVRFADNENIARRALHEQREERRLREEYLREGGPEQCIPPDDAQRVERKPR